MSPSRFLIAHPIAKQKFEKVKAKHFALYCGSLCPALLSGS
jgi:hypothetical protein